MRKTELPKITISDEFQHQINLFIQAMIRISSEYGPSLSHEEYMDKVEELFCELQQEDERHILA